LAVNAVRLAESLRPWRIAGLFHILVDPDAVVEPSIAGEQAAPLPVRERGDRSFFAEEQASSSGQESTASPILPQTWPSLWQTVLSRTKAAPLVWTYAELGIDLTRQGCRERSDFLRRLILQLQLPRGSSAFWPVWLPADAAGDRASSASLELGPGAQMRTSRPDASPQYACTPNGSDIFFQQGLRLLRPKLVIFFGQSSLELSSLPLRLPLPFTQQISTGVLFVLLPEVAQCLASPSLAESTGIFLRSALSAIPGIVAE
jgi:hypothetical protein